MRAFYCDHYEVPLPAGHRFPMPKYRMTRKLLLSRGLLEESRISPSQPVERDALVLAHDAGYVDRVLTGNLDDAELRRIRFPWSPMLVERSRASVGGTLAAAKYALEHGIAGNLAGGTHHAYADRGEGYCVFNDIAVAIRALQAERRIDRAVVVDLDVHQGNGTAAIFDGDPTVFTFSMHGEHNFPFRKHPSSRDVGLPDGTGDDEYLEALFRHLPEVLEAASADILFYQAGVDPLAEDALGRLSLTLRGLLERDRMVLEAATARSLPVVLTLGGGYARPIEKTCEAHANTYAVARELHG